MGHNALCVVALLGSFPRHLLVTTAGDFWARRTPGLCPKTTHAIYCSGRAWRGREKLSTSSSDNCTEERPDLTVSDHKQQKAGIAEQTED